jgi:hypothetical protein
MAGGVGGTGGGSLAGQMLQQFIIGISYGIRNEAEALSSMKRMEVSTVHLEEAVSRSFRRMTFEVTALLTAAAGLRALEGTFERIKDISDLSKRTGAAATDIQDLASAFKALGSTEAQAKGALEGIRAALDANPGVRQSMMVKGITEAQLGLKQMGQISEALTRIMKENGYHVALMFGEMWGLSAEHVRIMTDNRGKDVGSYQKYLKQMQAIRQAWGLDPEKVEKENRKLRDELNKSSAHIDEFQRAIVTGMTPVITAFLKPLTDGLLKSAPAISGAIERVSKSLEGWASKKGKEFSDWLTAVSTPGTSEHKDFLKKMEDTQQAIRKIGDAVDYVSDKIKQIHSIPAASQNVADKVAKGIADFFGSLPVFEHLRDPASKTAQAMARKLIEGQEAERQATLNAIMPLAFGPYGMPIWEEGKTAQPLPPEYKHLERKTPEELLGGGDHGLQPVPGTVAPRTVAPKPLVPSPAPEPPKPWLLPAQSGYGGEGQTPTRRSGGLGRFGIADFGRSDPTERQASISTDEIEAAKKRDEAAIKQEKAVETFEEAVNDDKEGREEQRRWWQTAWDQAKKFAGDLVMAIAPTLAKSIGESVGASVGQSVGAAAGAAFGGSGGQTAGSANLPKGKPSETFAQHAPRLMKRLMEERGLTKAQAAGVLGNLGHESAGFTAYEEGAPNRHGTRGAGWAQWTDAPGSPRRAMFENWSKQHGLDPKTPEASERYLLEGDPQFNQAIEAVKKTTTTDESVRAFHDSFERSNFPNAPGRFQYARRAMELGAEGGGAGGADGQAVIRTGSGARVTVGSQYAENFKGFLKDYEAAGGKIDPGHTSGYVNRNIAGTNTKSYHGMDGGRAIDINMSGRNVISSGLPGGIAQEEALAKKWGLRPGSSFRNPDRGHFEVHDLEAARQALIRNSSRLGSDDRQTGAGTPLSSGPVANDNSRTITQSNRFNTTIHANDAASAERMNKRTNEQMAGSTLSQLKTNMR